MRICYISYAKYGAGDWVHTFQFTTALQKIHDDIVIHTPLIHLGRSGSSEQHPVKKNKDLVNNFRELRLLFAMFLRHLPEEFRLLKTTKPDVVILRQERYVSAILLCHLLGIPILIESNAPFLEHQFSPIDRLIGRKFWCWLEKNMMRWADHIIVVSKELKQYYVSCGLLQEQITAVPNGVDIHTVHPGIKDERIREKFGLQGKIVIGFSGNFAPWHGLDFLADAIKKLTAYHKKNAIALLLIGRPGTRVIMPDLPDDFTIITGRVPYKEIPQYLAAVDIFVAPYPHITPFYFSPLKIFEAMAMGKAVVASAQGQICELIVHGTSGLLYPPGDTEAFLKNIELLIHDVALRNELGRNARKTIETKYTWLENANRILSLCKQVANR